MTLQSLLTAGEIVNPINKPFATTFTGAVLIPMIAVLLATGITAIIRILLKQNKDISDIRHEVKSDSGGSLRDSVKSIELKQAVMDERLNNHIDATLINYAVDHNPRKRSREALRDSRDQEEEN